MAHPAGLPASLAAQSRPLVMAVLNVTPDSFSDGGRHLDPDAAIAHARSQMNAGADLVDVGGESTRPGARRISVDEELGRVLPVLQGLAAQGIPTSIDTTRAEVAQSSLEAGACLINDVSGGLADPAMLAFLARVDVPYVAMHWRGPSAQMDRLAHYEDVVAEVCAELGERLDALAGAGVELDRVVLDPGLGFAKTGVHNWELLQGLPTLLGLGHPVLVGASRKRFLGELLGDEQGPRPVGERDDATSAITALAAAAGVWAVRVHESRGSRDAVAVAHAWQSARGGTP